MTKSLITKSSCILIICTIATSSGCRPGKYTAPEEDYISVLTLFSKAILRDAKRYTDVEFDSKIPLTKEQLTDIIHKKLGYSHINVRNSTSVGPIPKNGRTIVITPVNVGRYSATCYYTIVMPGTSPTRHAKYTKTDGIWEESK